MTLPEPHARVERYDSVFRDGLFRGRVFLVTGGGTGIGRCIAHELARLDATVIIAGRTEKKLVKTSEEIRERGGKVDWMLLNIRDDEQANAVAASIVKKYGRIDGLVNNAGGQFLSPAASISARGFATVVDLNLNGTFRMCRAVFDAWMGENGGSIVNIVADMWNGFPMMAHTGAARAGVVNLTQSLAIEWGSQCGIRVNAIAPGIIISNGMNNYPPDVQKDVIENVSWQNPVSRIGTESEVAACVTFLMSPAAAFVQGATLRVDGGSSLVKGPAATQSLFDPTLKVPAYDGFGATGLQNEAPDSFRVLTRSVEKRRSSKL